MSRRRWALVIGIPVAVVLGYLLTSASAVLLFSTAFHEPDRPHAMVVNDTARPVRIIEVTVRTGDEMFVSGTIPPSGGSQQILLSLPPDVRCTTLVAYEARIDGSGGGRRRALCQNDTWHVSSADLEP